MNGDKFLKKLSAAAMETLSIIAYKQPVTKGQVEAIRGVSADYAIQKLLEKELIVISGRNETMPGHPLVYATSKSFANLSSPLGNRGFLSLQRCRPTHDLRQFGCNCSLSCTVIRDLQ